jgi:hypothetical protein
MTGPLAEAARRALEEEEALLDSECPPGTEPAPEAVSGPEPKPAASFWGKLVG